MNVSEAIEWVHSLPRLAAHPGVENTRRLLAKLGNPQKKLRFVHIAGTNGKGSTAVMLSCVLREAGYRTGLTVSPFVLDFRERFQINGEMIEPDTLAQILTEVRGAVDALRGDGWDSVVEFDAVTAAALVWFAREACDIVVMETGLGGRLDATNAVENTLVACITAIGFDHTELLGDTLDKIAHEKCGIFKNGCSVVCYPDQPQEALDEIILSAEESGCELRLPEKEDLRVFRARPFENRIDYGGYELTVPFPGLHQAYNACVVVEAALALCDKGLDVPDEAILKGIAAASFPARIEVLSRSPLVILDGAHNPDGARALAETLRGAKVSGMTAIMGVLHGKNAEKMLETLSPYFSGVCTVRPDSPRAMDAQELAALARRHFCAVTACESVEEAFDEALAAEEHGVCICGSLYLAAQARRIWEQRRNSTK